MIPDQENIVAPVVVQEKATRAERQAGHQQARTNVCARRTRLLKNELYFIIFSLVSVLTTLIM
jgi:hypothetical protein